MVHYFDLETIPQCLEILSQMYLRKYDLLEKFLINHQTEQNLEQKVYLEQKCTRLLNLVDNHYWNYYSELILLL